MDKKKSNIPETDKTALNQFCKAQTKIMLNPEQNNFEHNGKKRNQRQ